MRLESKELQEAAEHDDGFASRLDEDKKSHWSDLKGQGFAVHWHYFWSYYWIPVVIIVAVAIFGTSLAHDILSQKPSALSVICLNAPLYADVLPGYELTQEELEGAFAEYAGIDLSAYSVNIDRNSTLALEGYGEMDIAVSQRIMAMVAGQDLDVMTADSEVFHSYARSDMFADLRDVLPAQELAQYEVLDQVTYIDRAEIEAADGWAEKHPGEDLIWPADTPMADPIPVGIRLVPGSPASPAIGVMVNTERSDMAAAFIRFMDRER